MIEDSVSILIPLMRPEKLQPLIANVKETTSEPYEIIVASTQKVADQTHLHNTCQFYIDNGGTYAERMNRMFDTTSSPFVFLAADDVLFHRNWLDHALQVMETTRGVVVPRDLLNPNGTHCLVARAYVEEFGSATMDNSGSLLHSGYKHAYCDAELFETAKKRGRFAYARKSIVEHLHWANKKSSNDAVYKLGESFYLRDQQHFNTRRHLWV